MKILGILHKFVNIHWKGSWVILTTRSYPFPQFLKSRLKTERAKSTPCCSSLLLSSTQPCVCFKSDFSMANYSYSICFCVDIILQGIIPIFGAVSSAWLDPRLQHLSFGVERKRSSLLSLSSSPCLKSSTHSSNWIDALQVSEWLFLKENTLQLDFVSLSEEALPLSLRTPPPFLIPLPDHARGHIWARRQLCLG